MVNDPLEKMTFEDAMKELENLVDALDKGDVSLDEAIAAYDRGSQLKEYCEKNGLKMFAFVEKLIREKCKPKTDIYGDEVI